MTHVLFVCVANSGRSVMAERIFRSVAGDRHDARSAGSEPGTAPHPHVVAALAEIGIDARDHVPRALDDGALAWADVADQSNRAAINAKRIRVISRGDFGVMSYMRGGFEECRAGGESLSVPNSTQRETEWQRGDSLESK